MKALLLISSLLLFSCSGQPGSGKHDNHQVKQPETQVDPSLLDTAYFAGGCFWCIEASFEQIRGVKEAISGFSGGEIKDPGYKEVSSGQTNHAETVQVIFDPTRITYKKLLEIFFTAHDPTQLNRQGPDVGKQYRSVIFYRGSNQLEQAKAMVRKLENSDRYKKPIVTRLDPFNAFYKAEEYHQDYEAKHPENSYIQNVSRPKINRVKKKFSHLLKEE